MIYIFVRFPLKAGHRLVSVAVPVVAALCVCRAL